MRRQLSALLWRILAPTLEVAREEGREEVRTAVRDVLDQSRDDTTLHTYPEQLNADIHRALEGSVPPPDA